MPVLFRPGTIMGQQVAGGSDATISLVSNTDSACSSSASVAATTYTHTGLNLGSGSYVVVAYAGVGSSGGTTSSITVGGNSCTLVQFNSGVNSAAIGIATNPSPGGTGDIVITRSNNLTRHAIELYAVSGISSTTAYDSGSTSTWTSNVGSLSVNVPAGGVCVGCAYNTGTNSISFTWTGLTEDKDFGPTTAATRTYTSASLASASGSTPLSITATGSSTTTGPLIAASWDN